MDILVRGLDETTARVLARQAHAHGLTLEDEARMILETAVAPELPEAGVGTQIAALFRCLGVPRLEEQQEFTRPPPDFSGPGYGTYDDEPAERETGKPHA